MAQLVARGQTTIVTQKDAYTITQSVSEYIFPAAYDGKITDALSFVSSVQVALGDSPITNFSIGAITKPTGFTAITVDDTSKTITYSVDAGTTTLADSGVIAVPVIVAGVTYNLSFNWSKSKAGPAGEGSASLDWVADWNSAKTVLGAYSLITPKIFAGAKNADGTITGVAIGKFPMSVKNDAGTVVSETINGIYGFKDGNKTFYIDASGNAQLGRGTQYIRYNSATGKVEFGADVSLNWIGATYIDKDGIFTGTLSATTVNAIRVNATQITAGTIDTARLNVTDLKAQLITAGNIEALTLNVVKGKVGGWSIDADSIYRGTKDNTVDGYTAASGAITIGSNGIRGYKWRLESTGAGALAAGNITWDVAGNVSFAPSVSLNWLSPILNIEAALGGASFGKLTHISATGIYTGSLSAEQVNAVGIDATSIKTGVLGADRIDAASLRAEIINVDYINGLSLTFVKGLVGGWTIDTTGIYTGSFGTLGAIPIQLRTASSGSGYWYTGAYKPCGLSLLWYQAGNAGHIAFGQVAASGSTVKTGFMGIQMMSWDGLEYFCLSANTLSGSKETYNRIAGWGFDSTTIWKNNVSLGADGSITNGTIWQLNNNGSGRVANGNIAWDASGNVIFGSSVSLNWTTPINNITTALGGVSFPKMTYISGTGIYTGTLTAQQINVAGLNASNITTGTLSANRIAAGSLDASKLNAASVQADIVNASYINGLSLDFCRGTIGNWTIDYDAIRTGSLNSVYARPIQIRPAASGSGYWYTGQYQPFGVSMLWRNYYGGGHISFGDVAASASSVKTGFIGIQMMDSNGCEYFCLAANAFSASNEIYNRIAGWAFDDTRIWKNNVSLGTDGSIANGVKWKLNNDGSGQIAGGNIAWDAAGNVTFSAAVALNWSNSDVSGIVAALGGAGYPKLTRITSAGIYTGTISAGQVTVDSTLLVGGSTNNGSIVVLDATNELKALINRSGIYAIGGTIGGWNITPTTINAGSVSLSSGGTIYNGNYWRLNNDGSGLLAANNIYWDAAGNITMKNATIQDVTIKGTIRSPFVRVDGSIAVVIGGGTPVASRPDSEKYDNMCVIAGTDGSGWGMAEPALPWNIEQSGRRLCLTHYRYNNEIVSGYCTFTAPSGYYFYEYGRQSTKLKMSREVIELMGYGTSTQFYGWIVLNRRDLLTAGKYGAFQQYLAMGTVTCTSTSAATLKYKTYDGSTMSISKSGMGNFFIYMPWSLGVDKYMVILTGKISAVQNTPIYATVKNQYASYFQVQTQDDESANEGSFNFIVVSTADFV